MVAVSIQRWGNSMSLYENIHKKRQRIKDGSGEKMRKKGAPGAPTEANFARAAKTAKKNMKKGGFPDLTGDGKVTRKDILKGRGVDLGHGGNVCSNRKKMMYGGGTKSYTTENKRYGGGVPNPRMPDPMD